MQDKFILCVHRGHNASCSIMNNGEIIAVGQEERFSRIKNDIGYPRKSIDFCLKEANIQPEQISEVAYTTKGFPSIFTKAKHRVNFSIKDYMDYYGKKYKGNNNINEKLEYLKWLRDDEKFNRSTTYFNYDFLTDEILLNNKLDNQLFQEEQRKILSEHLNFPKDNIKFLDHHTCHAYYAYYASPFNNQECIVLTMDGGGDGRKMSVWKAINNKLEFISDSNECDVCEIYKLVTLILGMRPDQDEYKVMGLAPYAKEKYIQEIVNILDELLEVDGMKIKRKKKVDNLYLYLQEKLQGYRFDNIAGGLQKFTENILSALINNIIKETGVKRFVISGGISMNVKNNKNIMEIDDVEDIFIPASGGDESLSIGGCYFLNCKNGNNKPINNVYLGLNVKNETIDKDIIDNLEKKYIVNKSVPQKEVAKLIYEGKIIGRVSGRAEFGARALGNRSIIGNPSDANIVEKINSAIKNRDFWMPFAISILEKYSNEYIINTKHIKSPFMTIAFDTKQNNYERIKAGTHPKDKTARPQVVNEENNKEYYDLINEFYKISGIPALLNTSFNLHGYPVINNIVDAIKTFENSGLDCLYINDDILIQKR